MARKRRSLLHGKNKTPVKTHALTPPPAPPQSEEPVRSTRLPPVHIQSFSQTPSPSIRNEEVLDPSSASPPVEPASAHPAADEPKPAITATQPTGISSTAAAILEPSDALQPPHRFSPPGEADLPEHVDDFHATQELVYPHPHRSTATQRSTPPKATPIPGGFDEDFGPRPSTSKALPLKLIGGIAFATILCLAVVLFLTSGGDEAAVTLSTAASGKPRPAPIIIAPPPIEVMEQEVEEENVEEPKIGTTRRDAPVAVPDEVDAEPAPAPATGSTSPWGIDAPPVAAPPEEAPPAPPEDKKRVFKRNR